MSRSNPCSSTSLKHALRSVAALVAMLLCSDTTHTYDRYSENRDSTNCRACHRDFRASTYDEQAPDGGSWPDGLHDTHRNTMLDGDCDTCHGSGPRFPVRTDTSAGGTGLAAISCVGCHGRLADASSGTLGAGAGLRQRHWRAGETVCLDCHADADPSNFMPVAEQTLPPYYANPGSGHPSMPRDPCDPSAPAFENYAGTAKGLDNDGDGLYDAADPHCGLLVECGNGVLESGEDCDDGNTASGDCCSASCAFESAGSICNDAVGCTSPDVCDGAGNCAGTPVDALCDDGQFCNGAEICDALQDCQAGTPVDCADAVGCTLDDCDEDSDSCTHAANDALCDDGHFCNGAETCDALQDCQAGTPVDCADAVGCTLDDCDEDSDSCTHAANDALCDDGQFCNGTEACHPTLDCQEGASVNCDDGELCTDDICNDVTDLCDHIFNPNNDPQCAIPVCGNGFVEEGEQCDDGNVAGGDCCSASCTFEPADSMCDDNVRCTTLDVCDGAGACSGSPDDDFCDDGEFCNGVEICNATQDCQPGVAVECDDGVPCTMDRCDETIDACAYALDDTVCDDGLFCNGLEICDASQDCLPGTPVDCDDGVGCTVDDCDEIADACIHSPDDTLCDDGRYCDGAEFCDPLADCQDGPVVDCDDGDVCTDDVCDDNVDACENVFDVSNDPACESLCPDEDSDGFSANGGVCGALDCDDSRPDVNPAADEQCDDSRDNDCDQLVDAADDECGFTGEWVVRDGPRVDPAYAGSTACMACHERHFQSWRDSLHARILVRPGDAQAAGFPLPAFDPSGGVELQTWDDVLFVIGQKWKTRLVDRNGFVQGTQWNYLRGEWSPYNDGETAAYDCGACHTTGYDESAEFLDDRGQAVPGIRGSWVEFSVGCEACHGPGAEHAAAPSSENINRIAFDWYDPDGDGTPDPVSIRSSVVCGNCHYRGDRRRIQADRESHEQYNDWSVSGHAFTVSPDPDDPVEFASVNTYCAKCHSPGNAEAFASEHNFNYYEPADATHVACISCHDPHANSQPRWATLEFPGGGVRDPREHPAALARYRGTDDDAATSDYEPFDNQDPNALCGDCHRQIPGFRRHTDARAAEEIVLQPPVNPFIPGSPTAPFTVPHREHVEQDRADCVDCHMSYSRRSINRWDLRTHTFLPNEWSAGPPTPLFTLPHFADTCGQCHSAAQDCDWCHTGLGARTSADQGARRDPTRPRMKPNRRD